MAVSLFQWFLSVALFFPPASPDTQAEARHPFYVSVTEINHNATEKSLEVSCKFFADDFEHVLEKAYKTQLDINAPKDKAAFDRLVPDYVAKHFSLTVDGKPLTANYVGFEREKESVYCYFEVGGVPAAKRLDLTNSLLYDLTPEQINIMHVTIGGKRQSGKLSAPEVKTAFQF